jgi:hypothetical protein
VTSFGAHDSVDNTLEVPPLLATGVVLAVTIAAATLASAPPATKLTLVVAELPPSVAVTVAL